MALLTTRQVTIPLGCQKTEMARNRQNTRPKRTMFALVSERDSQAWVECSLKLHVPSPSSQTEPKLIEYSINVGTEMSWPRDVWIIGVTRRPCRANTEIFQWAFRLAISGPVSTFELSKRVGFLMKGLT
jgi:hypothetical protein